MALVGSGASEVWALSGVCAMGKRGAASTISNPMLAGEHLQEMVLEEVGDERSAAARRAMQMVQVRH
eukprot:COSAG02_NODE_39644_length_414_cov_1.365079_1_plen_66_part_10